MHSGIKSTLMWWKVCTKPQNMLESFLGHHSGEPSCAKLNVSGGHEVTILSLKT